MSVRAEALRLVRSGHDLHYAGGAGDPDLALLRGDQRYALALERLAAVGDLETIAELADLISACARAQAEDRPQVAEQDWSAIARRHGVDLAS